MSMGGAKDPSDSGRASPAAHPMLLRVARWTNVVIRTTAAALGVSKAALGRSNATLAGGGAAFAWGNAMFGVPSGGFV